MQILQKKVKNILLKKMQILQILTKKRVKFTEKCKSYRL